MKKRSISQILAIVIIILGAISMLIPFLWMISTSLKEEAEVFTFPVTWIPKSFKWENYKQAIQIGNFGRIFFNSTFVALATTILALLFNSMAAYAFSKFKFKGRNVLFIILLATMMIPGQVIMIPIYLLFREMHLLNSYAGLIIPGIASAFGIFMMRQFMVSLPDELLDAARMDGASEIRIFFQLILPMVKAPLAALAIFTFMGSWNDYFRPLILITKESMKTLPLFLSSLSSGLYVQSWPLVMAATVIITLPIMIVFFSAQKYFIEGMALSGLK
ncbi:carbohydrate ABC transporter permease [Enterococcus massiliensis]|uniref:carbohydrate ABC transporter permease n=1 Tax=Enterococcus massiliensis TaxID=1640685 RepID=UPI00065DDEE3|nr:carbohydrate ABC transporter permease [Enterococcus massiliensis]